MRSVVVSTRKRNCDAYMNACLHAQDSLGSPQCRADRVFTGGQRCVVSVMVWSLAFVGIGGIDPPVLCVSAAVILKYLDFARAVALGERAGRLSRT